MEVEGTIVGCFDDAAAAEEPCVSDQELSKKCSSGAAPPSPNDFFDCSICLDFAVDPVVTVCGHLYCWPCIYKWLQVETASPQQCPVCKAALYQIALVPLYGRGALNTKDTHESLNIPNRSSVLSDNHSLIASAIEEYHSSNNTNNEEYIDFHPPMQQRQPIQNHHHRYPDYSNGSSNYMASSPSPFGSGVLQSTAGGILAWVSRNHHRRGMYLSSPDRLVQANGGSPSQIAGRRQEMRVESSLHLLWLFLFSCAVLCLLFF